MKDKQKVFFISYFYPPVKAVGTLRNYYLSHLFHENGYDVTVNRAKPIGYLHHDQFEINESIKVNTSIALDYHFFDKSRKRKKQNLTKKVENRNSKWISYFPINLLVGEGGIIYFLITFFRLVFKLRRGDILWTSYSPYTDAYLGAVLKMVRPSIIWISDWRDVDIDDDWPDTKMTRMQKKINYWFFKRSDLVVSVCEGYLRFVSKYSDKKYLLRNGIKDPITNTIYESTVDVEKLTITYVGGLYTGRRDPSHIFKAVRELIDSGQCVKEKFLFKYAGLEGNLFVSIAKEYGLDDICDNLGLIPFDQSQQIQRSTDINMMLTWVTKEMNTFPAKFYEYINSERPILLLIKGMQDKEFETIFEKHPSLGSIVYDDAAGLIKLKEFILMKYEEKLVNGKLAGMKEGIKEEFQWDSTFAIFDQWLHNNLLNE